jgi:WD40 repeat protein
VVPVATTSAAPSGLSAPPFVGPRPFRRDDPEHGRDLFGRDRDLDNLFNLLISERIVLMYSPSGAGKTSLIQAKLLPRMEAEGFVVWPTVRVGLPPDPTRPGNRYLRSALACLGAPESDAPPTLDEYLRCRAPADAEPQLLVLDQFEEVLVEDPTDRDAKEEFFRQLGVALRARERWALVAMREEHVAALDPYLRFVPTRLSAHFRLDLLDQRAALAAIVGPAQAAGVDLRPVAERLVNDLRRERRQRLDGTFEQQAGPSVEPVQLQVVCLRLWASLPPGTTTVEHLDLTWDVDQVLAEYYAERVGAIAATTGVPERQIREWVEQQLITPQGLRDKVLQQPAQTAGLPNGVIQALEDAHLVRGERQRGATWFELAHDRLIDPIRQDNKRWLDAHLTTAQRRAQLWAAARQPEQLLLRGRDLEDAQRWLGQHPHEASDVEREYLAASRRAEDQRRALRRLRLVIAALAVLALGAVAAFVYKQIQGEARLREVQLQDDARLREANRAAEIAQQARNQLDHDPELSLLLAIDAEQTPRVYAAEDALRAALVASHIRAATNVKAGPEYAAEFSPDGRYILAAADDGKARLWRLDGAGLRGAPIEVAPPVTNGRVWPLTIATFSPDAGRFVAAGSEHTAWVWDARTLAGPLALTGHTGAILGAAFSPDGRRIVTGSADHTARVWDGSTGEPQLELRGHTDAVTSAVYSPDGSSIVTVSYDGSAIVWDAATGAPVRTLPIAGALLFDVAFDPAGARIVTASQDGTARVSDPGTGALLAELRGHTAPVLTARFSPDGRLIVTASEDGTARLWDATTYLQLAVLRGQQGAVREAAFDPTSTRVVTASEDGMIREWAAIDAPLTAAFDSGAGLPIHHVEFSPDGRWLLAAGEDDAARVWDTTSGSLVATLAGHTKTVFGAGFSPDGQHVVTASADGTARVWDLASAGQPLATLPASTRPLTAAAFSPDGRRVVTAGVDGTARVWDAANDQPLLELRGHTERVTSAVYSPDGSRIATGSADTTARVWDAAGGRPLLELRGHTGALTGVVFSADGSRVVTSSADGTVMVWDAGSGESLAVLARGGSQGLNGVALGCHSNDAALNCRWIVTAGADGVVGVWDGVTYASLMVLRSGGALYTAAYDPTNSHRFAVGTDDGRVLLYRCEVCAPVTELLDLARQRVTRQLTDLERREFEPPEGRDPTARPGSRQRPDSQQGPS